MCFQKKKKSGKYEQSGLKQTECEAGRASGGSKDDLERGDQGVGDMGDGTRGKAGGCSRLA